MLQDDARQQYLTGVYPCHSDMDLCSASWAHASKSQQTSAHAAYHVDLQSTTDQDGDQLKLIPVCKF